VLPDGIYDAIVVDAEPGRLELTILGGEHKGEVVGLRSTDLAADPTSLLGIPATLTVADGVPTVELEP
jgi:hypothetical protein